MTELTGYPKILNFLQFYFLNLEKIVYFFVFRFQIGFVERLQNRVKQLEDENHQLKAEVRDK